MLFDRVSTTHLFRLPDVFYFLASSRIWNETWLSGFFYKPCNYELFVKQSLNMEMAIVMARVRLLSCLLYLLLILLYE
jgi:hypothetical protein